MKGTEVMTEEQINYLSGFVCEPLFQNDENIRMMELLKNTKGKSLIRHLKQSGKNEDEIGNTKYYIVKREGTPYLFFSIRCGSLFEAFPDKEEEDEAKRTFWKRYENQYLDVADDIFKDAINFARVEPSFVKYEMPNDSSEQRVSTQEEIDDQFMNYVRVIHPSIEMRDFCVNESAKEIWKSFGFTERMGVMLFRRFVIVTVYSVSKVIGAKYLYLFTKDRRNNHKLVNYYIKQLGFLRTRCLRANTNSYYEGCIFLYQFIGNMADKILSF